jgi:hypothetical protein
VSQHRGRHGVDPAVAAGDAGVVDQDVEASEPVADRGEHVDDAALVGNVGAVQQSAAARSLELARERLCRLGVGVVVDRDVVDIGRGTGDGCTNASRGAGDQHHRTAVTRLHACS